MGTDSMTPTDSAEKVVAELRKINSDYDLSRGIHYAISSAAALLESQRATIERVERERDEALLELGKARLCVNCGQTVRVEDISEVGDCSACQGPDGLSACTFDVVPAKAFEIWRDRYYDQRARVTALDAEKAKAVADEREACAKLVEDMPIQIYRDLGIGPAGRSCKPATFDDAAELIRARQALSRSTEVKNDG